MLHRLRTAALRQAYRSLLFFCAVVCGLSGELWAGASWQAEWERVLEAAKQEAQVNVYIKIGYDGVFPAFKKRFPAIRVVGVTGQVLDVGQRILAERRAGKYLADVVSLGIRPVFTDFYRLGILDPVRPLLLLPEVMDESKWRGGHLYADPEKKYMFIYFSVVQEGGVHYNTRLVNPKEFKSFWDLVSPKWRGKIEARDVRTPGPGGGAMRFFYHSPKLGPKFIRQLFRDMDITLFRDPRQGPDWLATGKFTICFFCSNIDTAKEQGLPVGGFDSRGWGEGAAVVSHSGQAGLMKNAPHPNAAKVFVNWILSREGQMELQRVLARVQAAESRRIDIPKDDVPEDVRWAEGIEYMELDSRPEWIEMGPVYKIIDEALKEAKR